MLLCLVFLFDLACFFLPFLSSLIKSYILYTHVHAMRQHYNVYGHVHVHNNGVHLKYESPVLATYTWYSTCSCTYVFIFYIHNSFENYCFLLSDIQMLAEIKYKFCVGIRWSCHTDHIGTGCACLYTCVYSIQHHNYTHMLVNVLC